MQLDTLSLENESEYFPQVNMILRFSLNSINNVNILLSINFLKLFFYQELVECCADMNSRNGIKELSDIMAKISNHFHDSNKFLEEVEHLIQVRFLYTSLSYKK